MEKLEFKLQLKLLFGTSCSNAKDDESPNSYHTVYTSPLGLLDSEFQMKGPEKGFASVLPVYFPNVSVHGLYLIPENS